MQTEPMPLLIRAEPNPDSKDESDRCDMCRYKNFYDKWTWYDMYDILQDGMDTGYMDTMVGLVQKIEYLCKNPLLVSVMTPDILSTVEIDNWFRHDFDKVGGYYREDPITKEQVRVPRRRVYFWDDEMTDYDALCQTIVNILSVIDDWVWEQTYPMLYYKVDGEKTMIANINEIYDTIIEMYNTVIESEDEECDSVS
jgi:hypothetical protein